MTVHLQEYDIAIIGGGIVGASLALLLAQQKPQWKIALLEAQAFAEAENYQPNFDARSTAIAHGSVEILRELGVWETLVQQATAISQVHVSDAGHFMGGLIDAATYDLASVGYVIENAWIGRALAKQIKSHVNIVYLTDARVELLMPRQLGAELKVKCGQDTCTLLSKLAVIADGGNSPLRDRLGITSSVKNYRQSALIANVAYTEPHGGVAYERFTEQGPLALLPLGESAQARTSALVLTLPEDQVDTIAALDEQGFLQHLQQRFGYRLGKFLRVSKRYIYPLQLITTDEQIRSHIVLMGNAAHSLHPVAGQGFNLSLRDCACLAKSLSEADTAGKNMGELSVLQDYLRRQQLDQALTIEFSDKLVQLFSSSALPLIALRHLGFIGLDMMPALKSQFAAQTMGTAGNKYF